MGKFIVSFRRQGTITPEQPSTPSVSDLVELGILTKQISEFTNDDIGTTVYIPYNDESGKILLNDGRIEFEVVGVNHHTSDEHPTTITLMTKNIIRYAAFDAKEPNNPNSNRKNYGNNRWSVSNIRQWLNSSGAAGSWWTAQHEYDAAPIPDNVSRADGAYAVDPGFLAGFSENILQHFTDITNITSKPIPDGGGSEYTVDKVFLPSLTEMGFNNNNSTAEGSKLSGTYTKTKNGSYWMRSFLLASLFQTGIIDNGSSNSYSPFVAEAGIAPIIVLH